MVIVLIFPRGTPEICGGLEVRSAGANRRNSTPSTQIESSFPCLGSTSLRVIVRLPVDLADSDYDFPMKEIHPDTGNFDS
jgi:hypothetical protein